MGYPCIYQGTKDSALPPPQKVLVLSGGSEGRGRGILGREKVRSEFRQRQHMSSGRHRDGGHGRPGDITWLQFHCQKGLVFPLKIPLSPGGTKLGAHCGMKRGGTTVGPVCASLGMPPTPTDPIHSLAEPLPVTVSSSHRNPLVRKCTAEHLSIVLEQIGAEAPLRREELAQTCWCITW